MLPSTLDMVPSPSTWNPRRSTLDKKIDSEPVGRDGFRHSRQTHKHRSRIPCPIFGESRFPGNSQIPDPFSKFIVFPIPAPYFGQIPNPENTLPDPL